MESANPFSQARFFKAVNRRIFQLKALKDPAKSVSYAGLHEFKVACNAQA